MVKTIMFVGKGQQGYVFLSSLQAKDELHSLCLDMTWRTKIHMVILGSLPR